ncbi:YbxH family protein [Cytobacillus sp. IB215665]|uniref:YbxH family protein n=1 Tax=Cytobacillus sp. IB215665 TaxID=3097357 RepID=UPI002A109508|nr:YbxH family protein [Cytobacillus sp. IB215665]MDX8367722.1 YbxH family protein [Cytobacillus sp. IB215665]
MGAIDRNGYRFEPEYSLIEKNGAIHVYNMGELVDEVKFSFSGKYPELDQIEQLVDEYCEERGI